MQFLCVRERVTANIFGEEYHLMPLDTRAENLKDVLVTDNFSARELLSRHAAVLSTVSFDRSSLKAFPHVVNDVKEVRQAGRVLIIRNGGIGDHIMFLPVIEILKKALPAGSQIWLAVQREKHPIFFNHSDIKRILPLPLRLDLVLQADYLFDMGTGDAAASLREMNLTDHFLDFFGLRDCGNVRKNPKMLPRNGGRTPIRDQFRRIRKEGGSKHVILLNWKASCRMRDLPPDTLLFLADEFDRVVFIVAQPRNYFKEVEDAISAHGDRIIDLSGHMNDLEDYICTISECDAVVSTDTSTGHLAEAVGKPSLTVFGAVNEDLRIRYYQKAHALRAEYIGKSCSSPCARNKAADGCPEAKLKRTPFAPCLMSIPKNKIRSAFRRFAEKVL